MQQLLEMLMGEQNQSNISDIMDKFGLDESQTKQAIGALLPGVTKGIQQQAQAQNQDVLSQIANAQQQQYLDDDNARLYDDNAVAEGQSLLGQIFGSSEESNALTGQAAEQTGLDSGILGQLLPMVTSMTMGGLGKQANAQGVAQDEGGLMSMLTSSLDTDGDGIDLNDIMGLASRFLR